MGRDIMDTVDSDELSSKQFSKENTNTTSPKKNVSESVSSNSASSESNDQPITMTSRRSKNIKSSSPSKYNSSNNMYEDKDKKALSRVLASFNLQDQSSSSTESD